MSFFEEEDEPRRTPDPEARRPRRPVRPPRGGSGRPPGGSGRPPYSPQTSQQVQTRRAVAVGAVVVVVIVMALLIHGCEASQSTDALKNYAASVDTLMTNSGNTGAQLFAHLQSGELSSTTGESTLQQQLNTVHLQALKETAEAEALSAPSQLASTQAALVDVMKLRATGISTVADNIEGAASTTTSKAAVQQIARGMYLLAGSDVDYKQLVAPDLALALNSAGIPVGGTTGLQIYGGQVLNDLGWLNTRFIGAKTSASLPASVVNQAVSGVVQGHVLNYVSVNGNELSPTGTNTVPASPAPTFVLNFTNGGGTNEYDVGCSVTVDGVSDIGTTTYPETKPGGTYNCYVKLPEQPNSTSYEVTADIAKVPGEKDTKNNSQTYLVNFN